MASLSKQVQVIVLVVAAATILAAPAPALAADLLVGDSGWRLDCDFDDWVESHDFVVGDTLVFKYAAGRHSVVRAAMAASYAACSQDNNLGVWTSGDDRVTLNTSGDWWFFCGVGDHCQDDGMKFTVTVLPAPKLSSSSAPARARGGGVAAAGLAVLGAVVALLF